MTISELRWSFPAKVRKSEDREVFMAIYDPEQTNTFMQKYLASPLVRC